MKISFFWGFEMALKKFRLGIQAEDDHDEIHCLSAATGPPGGLDFSIANSLNYRNLAVRRCDHSLDFFL